MKLSPRERFLAKVCPDPVSGCWLWRGMVVGSGYGMVRFERKMYPAPTQAKEPEHSMFNGDEECS